MLEFFYRLCQNQWAENARISRKWLAATRMSKIPESSPQKDGAAREKVYEDSLLTLYRYPAKTPGIPVLIFYALVNKNYILDLAPNKSFIRSLTQQGLEVYLADWSDPARLATQPTLSEYVEGAIYNAVHWLRDYSKTEKINLMGICQAGTLSLMYTALHPQTVAKLITVVTPVDFHAGNNVLAHLNRHVDTEQIRDVFPTLSGDFINSGFLQLKPFELLVGKYLGVMELWDDPEKMELFLRMEKWIFDGQCQATPAWQEFVHACYQKNSLVQNQMYLGSKKISLSSINCPVLNITADKDHLVPLFASEALQKALGSQDYTHLRFSVGHIGIFVSELAKTKITPAIKEWLAKA